MRLTVILTDPEGAVVAGAHLSGWAIAQTIATEEVDSAGRDPELVGRDLDLPREKLDAVSDAEGVVVLSLDEAPGLLWLQVWLDRQGWPSYRLGHPWRLPPRRDPDFLGTRLTVDEGDYLLRLTVMRAPAGVAIEPAGTLPAIDWPAIPAPHALPPGNGARPPHSGVTPPNPKIRN